MMDRQIKTPAFFRNCHIPKKERKKKRHWKIVYTSNEVERTGIKDKINFINIKNLHGKMTFVKCWRFSQWNRSRIKPLFLFRPPSWISKRFFDTFQYFFFIIIIIVRRIFFFIHQKSVNDVTVAKHRLRNSGIKMTRDYPSSKSHGES